MNGTKIVFDTCAAVNLLKDEYDLSSLGIDIENVHKFTSVIVRMELLSKRNMSKNEEQILKEFLDDLSVIPLSEEIEKKAVEIRRVSAVKLPDCIVAATSILLDATLLTDDTDLLKLSWPGLRTQSIK